MRIPVDSTDAAEQRELEEAAAAAEQAERQRHDQECVGGWRGEDPQGRPIACVRCRPHLAHVACRTCQRPWTVCETRQARHRGRCCLDCDHQPAHVDRELL